ncbi:MAG: hypothetical protein ACOYLQ_15255 [Hyphomicrobiaceae bacterium]
MNRLAGLAGALALWPVAAAANCLPPDAGHAMKPAGTARFAAALRTDPSPVKVGTPFVVDLRVCALDGAPIERLAIDATMPAHRHGMNYTPRITAQGDGRHQASGFLFHMPGWWEITLSVYADGRPYRLTHGVEIK